MEKATEKIEKVASDMKRQIYPKEGLSFLAHVIGLFGQRLWFYHKTRAYTKKLNIHENCSGCGICAKNCPTQNLSLLDGKAVAGDQCTMCYRCISNARKRQLHFWGRKWLISTLSQSMYRQEIRLDVKRVILFSFSDRWLLI